MSGSHDIAQICLNGHTITSRYNRSPELRANFCNQCGEKTITKCIQCQNHIRGYYSVPGVISTRSYNVPSYCHACGSSYPWTEEKLLAAKELAEILDDLTDEEQEELKKSLDDLVKDGPRTVVATTKFKSLLSKTGSEISTGFKDILVGVVSESVKKSIWG
ncbi:DUF2321 domain-containing protein [Thalassorhabdus alkalitolerans]|uniref:DUF2321 domain-containing protein n=1 Tax=Thalassorhabdus alkalitolerans TaxID=2282697 RepID=UPI00361BF471